MATNIDSSFAWMPFDAMSAHCGHRSAVSWEIAIDAADGVADTRVAYSSIPGLKMEGFEKVTSLR